MRPMSPSQPTPNRGDTRIAAAVTPRVPRLLRAILGIPLEIKLLGANAIILGVAVGG